MRAFINLIFATLLASSVIPTALANQEPNKEEIAEKIVDAWQLENSAVLVLQKTGSEVVNSARIVTQGRLGQTQQQALLEEVAREVETYLAGLTPFVSGEAVGLKNPVVAPILTAHFSESELIALLEIIESPVNRKLQQMMPEIRREYENRVVEQTNDRVKAELADLTARVNQILETALIEAQSGSR